MRNITKLKDLAEELNVSITTVSKALNDHPDISEKRKKEIQEYARKVGYRPNQVAKSFRQSRTNMIGVILNDNDNPVNARIIRGIEETLYKHGYCCVMMNNHENVDEELKMIDEMRSLNVAGILLSPAAGNSKSRELLKKYGIPYVLLNRFIQEEEDNYVVVDDYKAAYMATEYLCQYQNEKVFFLNFMEEVSSAKKRLQGYKQALKDCGVDGKEDWIIKNCKNQTDGYESMKQILLHTEPPFSVLCYSDYIAVGAICAIQERGFKLPEDVALVGNDDLDILSFVKPRLTTVAVPKLRIGVRATELLLQLLNAQDNAAKEDTETIDSHTVMEPQLVIRETS
mgnify:CR=1 FL=1